MRTLTSYVLRYLHQADPSSGYSIEHIKVETPVREDWIQVGAQFGDRRSVLDFYRTTNSYILELTAANHQVETLFNYELILQELLRLGVTNVYDYGAGIGTFLLRASQLGLQGTYVDLDSQTMRFAKKRLRDHGIRANYRVIRNGNPGLSNNLECIVCTEVLEHVYDAECLVRAFYEALRPGGVLVVSESFDYVKEFCTHIPQYKGKGGRRFLRYLQKVGFRQIKLQFDIHPTVHVKV